MRRRLCRQRVITLVCAEISNQPYAPLPASSQRADKANGRSVMLDLLEQQNSLTINQ